MIAGSAIKLAIITIVTCFAVAAAVPPALRRARARKQRLAAPDTIVDHGVVTLRGTVKLLGEPLSAPLSGLPCVAFRASGRTFSKKGNRRYVDAEEIEAAMTPFVLVTKHGEVFVDGNYCDLVGYSAPVIPRKLELEQKFMQRVALAGAAGEAGFDEVVVKPGMKIAVHGVVREEVTTAGAEVGFREAPKRLRLTGEPLVIDL